MTRNKNRFRQADVTRAVKGVAAAGKDVKTIRIDPDGVIWLSTESRGESERKTDAYEHWKAEHG